MQMLTIQAAAAYPSELEDDVVLPSRRVVRVRALQRGDERPIRELYRYLSPGTRYRRFFSMTPDPPDSLVRLLVSVDYRRHLALLAEHHDAGGPEPIALADFSAIDACTAEVGLVVRDEWQRQGVGAELARRVLQAAEDRGFHRFIAHLRSENVAIRSLVGKLCDVVSMTVSGGVAELAFVRRRATAAC